MYIYVLDKHGRPLTPTKRLGKVRKLIKQNKAVPVCNNPFTIKLKYEPDTHIVNGNMLSFDPGRQNIGTAIINNSNDLVLAANVETNNKNIKMHMSERKEHKNSRKRHKRIKKQRKAIRDNNTFKSGDKNILRSKKECLSKDISYPGMEESIIHKVCRGKEAKFNNRKRDDNWLTPSARALIDNYVQLYKMYSKFVKIDSIAIEYNVFDFQKLDNINIKAWEYSKGPLYGFESYKDYINFLQDGKCLMCSKPIEHYHHITYKSKNGTDNPKNIAGLCTCCHEKVHNDSNYEEKLLSLKEGTKKEYYVGLLNTCMPFIIEELSKLAPVTIVYGNETKELREEFKLPKDHYIDAYVIVLKAKNVKNISKLNTQNIYKIKHFKKKSNNKIIKVGSRKYFYKDKLVAVNRHKAFNQKEDSLEEYKNKYLETHTQNDWNKHFLKLVIKPAKRTYTFHKNKLKSSFKPGDKIKYEKKNKIKGNTKKEVLITESIDFCNQTIRYNKTKNKKFKYCKVLESNSLVFI